jgi:hypothetical protein
MRRFACRRLDDAVRHALDGGQSLHLHSFIGDERRAPRCFVEAVRRGEEIAHLFDQDLARLTDTARTWLSLW